MLLYHPAFDPYHSAFRALRLFVYAEEASYEAAQLKILSFYLLFPELIATIRLPQTLARYRAHFKKQKNAYRFSGGQRRVFQMLQPIQDTGLRLLGSKRIVELDSRSQMIFFNSTACPRELRKALAARNRADHVTISFLSGELAQLPLQGLNGLKDRTGLMEYRYDPP